MGAVFTLFLMPIIIIVIGYELVVPFVPYILMISSVVFIIVGLICGRIFNKYGIYEKGDNSEKRGVRIFTDILRWLVRLDVYGNIILLAASVCLAIFFFANGMIPIMFQKEKTTADRIKNGQITFETHQEVADAVLENAMDGNIDELSDYYSDYAHAHSDLNEKLKNFCDNIPDRITIIKRNNSSSSDSDHDYENGTSSYFKEVTGYVDFTDENGNLFRLVICQVCEDDKHPDKVGIHSIELFMGDSTTNSGSKVLDSDDKPGVYIFD